MRSHKVIRHHWLDFDTPGARQYLASEDAAGQCQDFGIGETIAAISAAAAAAVPEEAATAAVTSGLAGAETFGGAAAGLAEVGGTAAPAAASWLPTLGEVGAVAGLGGTVLSAKAQADNAAYQSAVARSEAAALAQKANEDAAAGERGETTQLRRTQLAESRAQAVGAASGTEATSPDILTTEGQIAGQGTFNALSALYEGQTRSRSDDYQGAIDLFKADQYDRAAPLAVGGTVLTGLSSFIDKRARLKYYTTSGDNPLSFGLA